MAKRLPASASLRSSDRGNPGSIWWQSPAAGSVVLRAPRSHLQGLHTGRGGGGVATPWRPRCWLLGAEKPGCDSAVAWVSALVQPQRSTGLGPFPDAVAAHWTAGGVPPSANRPARAIDTACQ